MARVIRTDCHPPISNIWMVTYGGLYQSIRGRKDLQYRTRTQTSWRENEQPEWDEIEYLEPRVTSWLHQDLQQWLPTVTSPVESMITTVGPESIGMPGHRWIPLRNILLVHLCRLARDGEWERNLEPIIEQYDRQPRKPILQTHADYYDGHQFVYYSGRLYERLSWLGGSGDSHDESGDSRPTRRTAYFWDRPTAFCAIARCRTGHDVEARAEVTTTTSRLVRATFGIVSVYDGHSSSSQGLNANIGI